MGKIINYIIIIIVTKDREPIQITEALSFVVESLGKGCVD